MRIVLLGLMLLRFGLPLTTSPGCLIVSTCGLTRCSGNYPPPFPGHHRLDHPVADHIIAVQEAFSKKGLDYGILLTTPVEGNSTDLCRRYTIPSRLRDDSQVRGQFLQVFNRSRKYNQALPGYRYKMSVVYENRSFESQEYHRGSGDGRSAPGRLDLALANINRGTGNLHSPNLNSLITQPGPSHEAGSDDQGSSDMPQITRPERNPQRAADGLYHCTLDDCTDRVKAFKQKCMFEKHMDKHECPYFCPEKSCENRRGFSYPGGLYRHLREVHGKGDGPRNLINCPVPSCPRHADNGFTRTENLNEHMRRCHGEKPGTRRDSSASIDPTTATAGPSTAPEAMEVTSTGTRPTMQQNQLPAIRTWSDVAIPSPISHQPTSPRPGTKRKAAEHDLREANKRLQQENAALRRQLEAQTAQLDQHAQELQGHQLQSKAMMQRLKAMQDEVNALRAGGNAARDGFDGFMLGSRDP
ncbi:hypothetical protein F4780DRAFT_726789 [Xylariomycetidae sp. FL0641]|nr:hypothetical protein F4780DRAFT_726789 [Xylariomycetidae sp. FL0641]